MTSEMLEKLDLSQSPLRQNLLGEDIGDLLDRNTFLGLTIGRCAGGKPSAQPYRPDRKTHTTQYHKHPVPVPL